MPKLENISDAENKLVADAAQEFGEYFLHAQFGIDLLHTFIKSASPEAAFFMMFLGTVHKHVILAALSAVRLHHIQANFDLRYATESGAWAAFAIVHPHSDHFGKTEEGIFNPTESAKDKMHKWFEETYRDGNESLKRFKKGTNMLSTHANIVDAQRNFGGLTREQIRTSFFDELLHHQVQTDLWAVANLSMGLLDVFYGVNRDHTVLVLQDNFLEKMKELKAENDRLKTEMMNHPRLKKYNQSQTA